MKKIVRFVLDCWTGFKKAINEAENSSDILDNIQKVIFQNVEKHWGKIWKNVLLIIMILAIAIGGKIGDIAKDITVVQNIRYAITVDYVIEDELKKKDEIIHQLELENAEMRGATQPFEMNRQTMHYYLKQCFIPHPLSKPNPQNEPQPKTD